MTAAGDSKVKLTSNISLNSNTIDLYPSCKPGSDGKFGSGRSIKEFYNLPKPGERQSGKTNIPTKSIHVKGMLELSIFMLSWTDDQAICCCVTLSESELLKCIASKHLLYNGQKSTVKNIRLNSLTY